VSPAADSSDTNPPGGAGAGQAKAAAEQAKSEIRREVAIALQHDPGHEQLPKVIASGHGAVAQQILEIAFARGIAVREDADLAEVLSAIEIDSEIPLAALAAVAEILSYMYRVSAGNEAPDQPQTENS
jgi:flagellar biosynthesis protein